MLEGAMQLRILWIAGIIHPVDGDPGGVELLHVEVRFRSRPAQISIGTELLANAQQPVSLHAGAVEISRPNELRTQAEPVGDGF